MGRERGGVGEGWGGVGDARLGMARRGAGGGEGMRASGAGGVQ